MLYYFLVYVITYLFSGMPLDQVSRYNRLAQEADDAFRKGDYELALIRYRFLAYNLDVPDANVQLNLAACYLMGQDTTQAISLYQKFSQARNPALRALACGQLGALALRSQAYETAVSYLKQALQANPANETARYNYELALKTMPPEADLPPEEPEPAQPPEPDQPQASQMPEQSQTPEFDQPPASPENWQQINFSPERAEAILDAINDNEMQYIQQQKRKSDPDNRNLPDW